MKFLIDQDVYTFTIRFLKNAGYDDIVLVAERGLAQADDEEILVTAQRENRVLITRDRDYGNLVFVKHLGKGVIYLRIPPAKMEQVHEELLSVLRTYTTEELENAFIVVEATGHRVRKLL